MGYLNDEILDKGIKDKLISIDDKRITYYAKSEKSYSYKDPEEKVRAIVFIRLVLDYKYDRNDIDFEVKVPRRTPEDLADIVVYEKNNDTQPYIVVECKKDGITDNQFNQAIEQVFGNANSLRAKYAWVVAGNTETAFDVENFDSMERSKNVISEIPTSYGKISEYRFKKTKDKEKKNSLKIVSREELISTLEKCHQTVWQGGKLNPSDAFDEVSKILFCKLKDEKSTKLNEFYKFQIGTHEESKDVSNRIHKIYEEGKQYEPNVFSEDIKLDDEIIYKTVEHLQGININGTDLDSKGIAFERFMGDFFKGKMGQYFTPRNIVYFCVQMLDISEYERVLDPACGSGGFLLHAMDTVRKNAEKDFDGEEIRTHWHAFASDRLFGIEINEQIARVCKMNMIIHDDGHTNVISADTLDNIDKHHELNQQFIKESFDVILTNPPFGAKVLSNEKKYLGNYILGQNGNKVRASQSTEILFIERCYEYLKEKGRMAIVLPDGILTNTTLQYVRDFIMEHFRINAIVSIPQTAFSHYGAGVKCSLLFLTKETVSEDYDIFMASAEDVGYDATGRKTDKNDLEEILKEYKKFIEKKNFKLLSELCFLIKSEKLINKRIDVIFHKSKQIYNNLSKLSDYCKIIGGKRLPIGHYFVKNSNFRYLKVDNINSDGFIDCNKIPYISHETFIILKNYKLNIGDIIVSIAGTIGKVALITYLSSDTILTENCAKIIINNEEILNKEFLSEIMKLKIIQEQMKFNIVKTTIPKLSLERLREIQIPIPPIEMQKQIADIMQEAYSKKESLEKEASELLNSINDYVLNELDIKIDDNIKKEKCFTVKYSEIKNKRIDATYYSKNNQIKSKFDLEELDKYKSFCDSGSRPKGGVANIKNGIFSFGGEHIKDDGRVVMYPTKYIPEDFNKKILNTSLKLNDILIVKDGATTGKIGIVDDIKYENQNINEHLFLLRAKKELNQKYLFFILSNKIFQQIIKSKITGATVMGIIKNEILNIKIPIPPIEIQNKIADEATNRREKAFKLQEEAKKIIEEAKKEVESILF